MSAPTLTTRPFDARGGFNERRTHADGFSYWRNGELHREDGFAVFRDGRHEVWLFGQQIEVPEHDPRDPLSFGGQSKSGRITWMDGDGAIRAVTVTSASGVHETRWYDAIGDPQEHWRGNYHVRRLLLTGEKRYYRFDETLQKNILHRVDGPAIEDAEREARSKWCVDGHSVDGPIELLIKHTMRAEAAERHGRPIVRLPLTDAQKGRLRITVIARPDSDLATDIAMCFPDEYREAMIATGSL